MPSGVVAGGPSDALGDASLFVMAYTQLCSPSSFSLRMNKVPSGVITRGLSDAPLCVMAATQLCGASSSSIRDEKDA